MSSHKSSDYKLSAVKYYLSHSKNQVHTHNKIKFNFYIFHLRFQELAI